MFIPWSTDAPVYHWPFATVGLIVACVAVFVAQQMPEPEQIESFMLAVGDGIHPLQWVTNNFMHGDISHLIGNMIFLWAFGLIVEGKVGPLWMLAIFVGIGAVDGALEQFLFLHSEPAHALGASTSIYGLLAIALVWAPENRIHSWMFLRFYPIEISLRVVTFALLYLGLEIFWILFRGWRMSSEFAHLSGALLGLATGAAMVKLNLVDCEGWDLFSVVSGRAGRSSGGRGRRSDLAREAHNMRQAAYFESNSSSTSKTRPRRGKPKKKSDELGDEDRLALASRRLRSCVDNADARAAYAAFAHARTSIPGWKPAESDWIDLVKLVCDERLWPEAAAVIEPYLRESRDPRPNIRVKLAQIYINELQRPTRGRRVLDRLTPDELRGDLAKLRAALARRADEMVADGVYELEDEPAP